MAKTNTAATEESRDISRLGITLYDPETDTEFQAFTMRLSPMLRDAVAPIIEKDAKAREKIRAERPHMTEFELLGKAEGGADKQIEYYRENADAVKEETDSAAKLGRELNIKMAVDVVAAIVDDEHPSIEVTGDPEATAARRKMIRSRSNSKFWKQQSMPEMERAMRRFRAALQLG